MSAGDSFHICALWHTALCTDSWHCVPAWGSFKCFCQHQHCLVPSSEFWTQCVYGWHVIFMVTYFPWALKGTVTHYFMTIIILSATFNIHGTTTSCLFFSFFFLKTVLILYYIMPLRTSLCTLTAENSPTWHLSRSAWSLPMCHL